MNSASLRTSIEIPMPMQYLGSKQRIAPWILDEVISHFPTIDTFIDLMSGSGSVAHEANRRGLRVVANDVQPYSYAVLKSMFELPREPLLPLIELLEGTTFTDEFLLRGREVAAPWLSQEQHFRAQVAEGNLDWKSYQDFCRTSSGDPAKTSRSFDLFTTYYSNTYFGVRQSLEIDALRQMGSALGTVAEQHLVAAIISTMTFTASSTTHLAQFLKPTSERNSKHLILRRATSVVHGVIDRLRRVADYPLPPNGLVMNYDYQTAIAELKTAPEKALIYVDPPYFKEHYSRYYHVLDTLALYDYPELTYNKRLESTTVGRYRSVRFASDFGLKSKAQAAFARMFQLASGRALNVAISYASTSLLSAEQIVGIATENGYATEIREIALMHSGQGQAATNGNVVEYLFLCTRES